MLSMDSYQQLIGLTEELQDISDVSEVDKVEINEKDFIDLKDFEKTL